MSHVESIRHHGLFDGLRPNCKDISRRNFFVDDTDISLDGDIDFSGLRALGEYRSLLNGSEAEIIEHGPGTEIIAVNKAQITAAIFEALTTLRLA